MWLCVLEDNYEIISGYSLSFENGFSLVMHCSLLMLIFTTLDGHRVTVSLDYQLDWMKRCLERYLHCDGVNLINGFVHL